MAVNLATNKDKDPSLTKSFKDNFYQQPSLNHKALRPKIMPYRLYNYPLLTAKRELDPNYYDALSLLDGDELAQEPKFKKRDDDVIINTGTLEVVTGESTTIKLSS
jgi:hypothetical protein